MGLTPVDQNEAEISASDAVGGCKQWSPAQRRSLPQEKIRSGPKKPRRPDRAVYVPRALRTPENNIDEAKADNKKTNNTSGVPKCPKSPAPKEKSTHSTPKKSTNKHFCNVYTPPHLRHQRSHTAPSIDQASASEITHSVPSLGCQVPNSDSVRSVNDDDNISGEIEVGGNFYIGDYFTNGQLGFYTPPYFSEYPENADNDWRTNDIADKMSLKDYGYNKDEDVEENELRRASQEINRSSKRIIKQSFNSNVLVISDPVEEEKNDTIEPEAPKEEKEPELKKPKQKLEPKVSLKREENDWDAVFDDTGECLDPSLLEELTSTVGKVHISKAKNNYDQYQTRGQALFSGPYDETLAHVVEVYDFPSEFKTNDLLSLFSEYKETGFEIKWVDDTHALIVFSSAKIAAEVVATQRPLARCRPLHAATLESRNKAKKCAEFLQPYRQRPETCTALARRLVSGALGVRLSTAQQERAEERRLITLAREKKRQAALHKEAAWDGSLANQPVSES